MEASFISKRPPDHITCNPDPTLTSKRRLHAPPPSETLFRLLCPASKSLSLTRHLPDYTGCAKIHVENSVTFGDERVIVIHAENDKKLHSHESSSMNLCEEGSSAQKALVSVFERIVKIEEEGRKEGKEKERGNVSADSNDPGLSSDCSEIKGHVVCRLLAPSNQVGCVLGRGGKIVEKIRQESGAQIRVFPKDHVNIPACASPGDELIQITGSFSAVKKAILSVSSCLQDKPRVDATNSGAMKPLGGVISHGDSFPHRGYGSGLHSGDYHLRGYSSIGPENVGPGHRMEMEEDVVFKLLCQHDKVGSLIGRGGLVVRALQNETGASIKIVDASADSDERIVVISARESVEQKYSPAQEAVIRVHCRIAEIGFEPGAAVVARLLVHSQTIGCLLGKGGFIISEMRRATGASIRIFSREQVPKCGSPNDEVVQVIGSLQSVQDALFHITSRLRETIFPMRPPLPNFNNPPFLSPYPEMPPPLFRSRHNPPSPGHYPSAAGFPCGDRSAIPSQPHDHHPVYSHGTDFYGPNTDQFLHPYGMERSGSGLTLDRPSSSPRSWSAQAVSSGMPRGTSDVGFNLASRNGSLSSGNQAAVLTSTSVEVMIPQTLLSHVYGENQTNLAQIRQISGANVVVHDPKPGTYEGKVVMTGTADRIRTAQSLVHAFILCGKTSS